MQPSASYRTVARGSFPSVHIAYLLKAANPTCWEKVELYIIQLLCKDAMAEYSSGCLQDISLYDSLSRGGFREVFNLDKGWETSPMDVENALGTSEMEFLVLEQSKRTASFRHKKPFFLNFRRLLKHEYRIHTETHTGPLRDGFYVPRITSHSEHRKLPQFIFNSADRSVVIFWVVSSNPYTLEPLEIEAFLNQYPNQVEHIDFVFFSPANRDLKVYFPVDVLGRVRRKMVMIGCEIMEIDV